MSEQPNTNEHGRRLVEVIDQALEATPPEYREPLMNYIVEYMQSRQRYFHARRELQEWNCDSD